MHEIDSRLRAKGLALEWEDIKRDLSALTEVEVFEGEDRYRLRTDFAGCASKVYGAAGLAAPPGEGGRTRKSALEAEFMCSARPASCFHNHRRGKVMRKGTVEDGSATEHTETTEGRKDDVL